MAPPGTKVIVHEKPSNRTSWGLHGTNGWYIGPSLHHYRCVQCFMPATKSVRDADTVAFFPETIPFPSTTIEDHLRQATTDIIRILTQPSSATQFPTLELGDSTKNALLKIAGILRRSTDVPPLPAPPVKRVTFSLDTKKTSEHKVLPTSNLSPPSRPAPPGAGSGFGRVRRCPNHPRLVGGRSRRARR